MKVLGRFFATLLIIYTYSVFNIASAALHSRAGGTMVYDSDLNITWIADANYAQTSGYDSNGVMDWQSAINWVDQLVYGGYSDWRLPATLLPDSGCSIQSGSMSWGYNCTGSEMGHLFYDELGGTANETILASGDPDLALFTNIRQTNSFHWSGTEHITDPSKALFFSFGLGDQSFGPKGELDVLNNFAVWPVRDGDVSIVPLPPALYMFAFGIVSLIGLTKRKINA